MRFDPPRLRNDEERVLPLVNVVFLLLIFFMIAGKLAASDPFQTSPPQSQSDGQPETQDLLVLVGADGRLALDGEVMLEDALRSSLAVRLSSDTATRVRLKADSQAQATQVIAVMELLRDAGVERLKLLTVPEGH